jgi:hypothetical protein
VWQGAKDNADAQLGRLYDVLRGSGLPLLGEVAGEIEDTLEAFRVSLVTTLMSFDRATGDNRESARTAALKAVADARTKLSTDSRVLAADSNPFGVPISLQATLGNALEQLQHQLQPN